MGMRSKPFQRVDVFVDFLCPYCGKFHSIWGEKLHFLEKRGYIKVKYHPLAWIDRFSQGTMYSTRSASAADLIAREEPEYLWDFICIMFDRNNQPKEADRYNTETGSNAKIAQHALEAGVSQELANHIASADFEGCDEIVASETERVIELNKVEYTPTIKINGVVWKYTEPVDISCLDGLTDFQAAVLQVIADIKCGNVLTYGEVAKLAGYPKACRAVGSVCRTNPLPLIIPCHRVVPTQYIANPCIQTVGEYALGADMKWELLLSESK
ncbi:hypothetical protein FACS1894125_2730 [Actinomycetota bacterium]|nr:hypothetical protein FACS1894125_2730 [Actinomycetota bacterium]